MGDKRGSRVRARAAAMALLVLAAGQARSDEPSVRLNVGADEWIDRRADLRIELSRLPSAEEGRLAVTLDQVDVTDICRLDGSSLVYRADLLPLPAGESTLTVYRAPATGEWVELGSFQLRVLTRGGFERTSFEPSVDLQARSQFAEGHDPDDNAPARETFEDATLRLGVQAALERSGWRFASRAGAVGVTHREEALRFGQEGEEAPKLDLASYELRLQRDRAWMEVGHLTWGDHRHLIRGFSSRGLAAGLPIGSAGSVSAVVVNGSRIVGWDNILGLEDSAHQITAAAAGFELWPRRPGALRLDAAYLDGSLLPLAGFNQGVVNDAETSDGWSLRLAGETAGSRLDWEAGYTSSDFRNPFDPTLAQSSSLVEVESEKRSARYLDVDLQIVSGREIGGGWLADLSLALRHQRVEPQYRSVAAYVGADVEENGGDLFATFGPLNLQAGHSRSRDNLDDVPSVLTTKTRRTHANVATPLAELFRLGRPRWWIPMFNYSWDRTHQFGDSVPINAGFDPSHVPDQVSVSQLTGLDWQGQRWRFGYQLSHSDQDNRQIGRELADFTTLTHTLSMNVTPHPDLDLSLALGRERAASREDDRVDETTNRDFGLTWQISGRMTFTGSYSWTETEDDPLTSESDSRNLDAQWSYRFNWQRAESRGVRGQLFVRYFDQEFDSLDRLFGFDFAESSWTMNAGLNLSLY